MRARTKRVEDLDPGVVCCEGLAEMLRKSAGIELEVTEPIFTGVAQCSHCGREQPRRHYATVVGDPFGRMGGPFKVSVIALTFVDLEEGT